MTVDVTAAVVDVLGASPDPHRWGLVGLSAGGTCALTLALRHPDRYAVFADFSGDATPNLGSRRRTVEVLYGGDASQWEAHDPAALLAAGSLGGGPPGSVVVTTLRARREAWPPRPDSPASTRPWWCLGRPLVSVLAARSPTASIGW